MNGNPNGLVGTAAARAVLLAFCLYVVAGCVSAKITVIDERTALENQILGSYEELDRDLQLAASVRSADEPTLLTQAAGLPPVRDLAIKARRDQQFFRDDIDEMKKAGCLGETNVGTIAARPCPSANESGIGERIKRLIDTENHAREVLMRFIVTVSPDLTEKDLTQVIQTFSRIQRENAEAGTWIQNDNGEWAPAP
jgi:hypothetical protein